MLYIEAEGVRRGDAKLGGGGGGNRAGPDDYARVVSGP